MDIERMHNMIEKLTESANAEFEKGIDCVDTCEMGQVADMIKDISTAMYYRILAEIMIDADQRDILDMFDRYGADRRYYDHYRYKNGRFAPKGQGTRRGYEEPPYWHTTPDDFRDWEGLSDRERMRDIDRMRGRMYYTEPAPADGTKQDMRDPREGNAGRYRKTYMESKELHKDKETKMHDLENYMKELAEDITGVMADMTPEERTMAKTKMTTLVSKM